ncbi:hypothetical protein R7V75_01720 [Mesomycoplasma ovipneumoniae]|uniref:Uncharacterized protein n=1 Tax=Mesomycoplasma ovipneumoniae TaxID=29562 RepID=A0AAJ2UBM5_9BACT|nr:hypothetical protein [Mesomycoplasma ovipneumoniae]MDW2898384.1 hypothetical protein [Mesomycoplasma ovipneumoniae]MDW2908443.1 hypothetical protein [Mesomycoplasma ovipneumoniae]
MNKKPNIPLVKFKNFNSVWISDQVKNLFEISRGQSLTKNQIKSRPVERERERERERPRLHLSGLFITNRKSGDFRLL